MAQICSQSFRLQFNLQSEKGNGKGHPLSLIN